MDEYTITFTTSARRELQKLDGAIVRRIFPKIEALGQDPRPSGCRKLVGTPNLWRIRVGDYRVVYSIEDDVLTIEVIAVRHRRDAYRY